MPTRVLITSRRHSITRKVAVFFSLLALLGVGRWLILSKAQERLKGAGEDINAIGSLRYLNQQILVSAIGSAVYQATDGRTEALIATFEERLEQLEARNAFAGSRSGHAINEMELALPSVRSVWSAYRDDVQSFLQVVPSRNSATAYIPRLTQGAEVVLERTNLATRLLTEHVEKVNREARTALTTLAFTEVVILLAAILAVRRYLVHPLRQLAEASIRFADGDHGIRTGCRSQDEVGQLSEAFNSMAERTQMHIGVIAAGLAQIQEQQEKLSEISQAVVHSPASVVITDSAARIEYVNPAFVEITGYSYDEAVGQKPNILKSGYTSARVYKDLWRTIRSGAVWRDELLNRRKNGELFWEDTHISPVRNQQGEIVHFVAVGVDVTARKRAEDGLRALNRDLERLVAERTQRLTEAFEEQKSFSYAVSHDLRSPLRAINGFAHVMREDCQGCTRIRSLDHLQHIQNASIRMSQIIDGLLALGEFGRTNLNVRETNLSDIAQHVLGRLAAQEPQRHVGIEVEQDIVVIGDPRLLQIMLENLLGNAWKFTAYREDAQISFGSIEGEGGEQQIFVRDNGAGFDMNYAGKLFEPFQRLHTASEFDGTGVGLATVHRIVRRHGGLIWARAEPGQGATFFVVLPDQSAMPGAGSSTSPFKG